MPGSMAWNMAIIDRTGLEEYFGKETQEACGKHVAF